MTYRERRQARLERRLEWAAKRDAKAAPVYQEAEKYRGDIAFNTQPGHIPERARLIAREDRAHQDSAMADHHRAAADGLQRQLDRSVFNDDPNAIEALEARIAKREAQRDRMKEINRLYKRNDAAGLAALGLNLERLQETIRTGRSWEKAPYPGYSLTNLGALIRADKERIKTVQARTATLEAAAAAPGGVTLEPFGPDSLGVTFAEKPDRAILQALKAAGFYWSAPSWYGPKASLPAAVAELAAADPLAAWEQDRDGNPLPKENS